MHPFDMETNSHLVHALAHYVKLLIRCFLDLRPRKLVGNMIKKAGGKPKDTACLLETCMPCP